MQWMVQNEIRPDDIVTKSCRAFAKDYEYKFNSLQCSILRPEGFHPTYANPLLAKLFNSQFLSFQLYSGVVITDHAKVSRFFYCDSGDFGSPGFIAR